MAGSRRQIVALGVLIGLLVLSGLPSFGLAQDRAEYFQNVITGKRSAPLLSGPHGLALEQSAGVLTAYKAGLDVADFVAHAAFTNPPAEVDTGWDYGFQFRTTGNNEDLRLFVTSGGDWNFSIGTEDPEQTIVAPSLDRTPGAVNSLDLIVDGAQALFGINGEYAGMIVLPELMPSGDVYASTGFLGDLVVPGRVVALNDFSVFEVPSAEPAGEAAPGGSLRRPVTLRSGSCEEPGAVVETLLEASLPVGERQGAAGAVVAETSFTKVPFSMSALMGEPFAIEVAQSFENPTTSIACADIGGIPDEIGGFVISLSERGGSGYSGVVYLAEDAETSQANISVFLAPNRPAAEMPSAAVDAIAPVVGTPGSVIDIEGAPSGGGEATPGATPRP